MKDCEMGCIDECTYKCLDCDCNDGCGLFCENKEIDLQFEEVVQDLLDDALDKNEKDSDESIDILLDSDTIAEDSSGKEQCKELKEETHLEKMEKAGNSRRKIKAILKAAPAHVRKYWPDRTRHH